jgi:uncharacterized membrane protein
MTTTTEEEVKTAAAIGVVAGMRTFTAPAIIGQLAKRGELKIGCDYLGALGKPVAANTLAGLALSEIVADKLPMTPNRTDLSGFIPRLVSGALCGATLGCASRQSVATSALAGALGAAGGTFAAYYLRRFLTKSLGIPDLLVALAEDAAAVSLGVRIVRGAAREKGAA